MVTFARERVTAESSLVESRVHLETTTAPNSSSAASRSEALRVAAGFNPDYYPHFFGMPVSFAYS